MSGLIPAIKLCKSPPSHSLVIKKTMEQLKQPQLGQTIISLRQKKQLTQEELVERCNINVRTLQRIEAGEVTPRDFTVRSILSALEYDVDEVQRAIEQRSGNSKIQMAWIAGAIYFVIGLIEAVVDFSRYESGLPVYFDMIYTSIKLIAAISFVFFMVGFVSVGQRYENSILKIGAFLMAGSIAIMAIFDVVSLFSTMTEDEFLITKGIQGVMFGGADIVIGIGLFRLADKFGDIAKVAGLLEIAAGICFLTFVLSLFGLILWTLAIILEVVVLYQCYDRGHNSVPTLSL